MRGVVTNFFEGQIIIAPDGSTACHVMCPERDLPSARIGEAVEFNLAPGFGMFKAINIRRSA
jgi:hypothetical protein